MATPFCLQYDEYEDYFVTRSRYKFPHKSSYVQYCVDFLIVEVVESFVTVVAWR